MIEQWVIDRLNPLKSKDLVKVVQPTKPTTVPMDEKETNMTKTIHAVYENGVFRPTEKVDLPDHCEVEVEVRTVSDKPTKPSLDMCTPFSAGVILRVNTTLPSVTTSINHDFSAS